MTLRAWFRSWRKPPTPPGEHVTVPTKPARTWQDDRSRDIIAVFLLKTCKHVRSVSFKETP